MNDDSKLSWDALDAISKAAAAFAKLKDPVDRRLAEQRFMELFQYDLEARDAS